MIIICDQDARFEQFGRQASVNAWKKCLMFFVEEI